MQVTAWMVRAPREPMIESTRDERPAAGEVLIEVAGCGVCHTDLGFWYDGVPTRHPLPLVLGHEISGAVVDAAPDVADWLGRTVIVPAVIPCGECAACRVGRGGICPRQVFPGNDVHGGFATHVRVPAVGLCPVPDLRDRTQNPAGLDLPTLSVIADAVATPYQAVLRSGLGKGDLAVFVGVGGVGGFGVQIAHWTGAAVAAIDIDATKLQLAKAHGATLALDARELALPELRRAVRAYAAELGVPSWRTRLFETSGTPAGQRTAFGLLGPGGHLTVVGYTPQAVELRLSNVMAFDAIVQGNWGCLPERYPSVLALVLGGRLRLAPYVEQRPLATINETFAELHEHAGTRRVVLVPEQRRSA